MKMTPEVRRRYENYLLRRSSDEGVIEAAERKGEERGIKKERLEVARKLLPLLDDMAISETTDLTVKQIAALRGDRG